MSKHPRSASQQQGAEVVWTANAEIAEAEHGTLTLKIPGASEGFTVSVSAGTCLRWGRRVGQPVRARLVIDEKAPPAGPAKSLEEMLARAPAELREFVALLTAQLELVSALLSQVPDCPAHGRCPDFAARWLELAAAAVSPDQVEPHGEAVLADELEAGAASAESAEGVEGEA